MVEVGAAKSLDDITLSDVLEHPIWLWTWEMGNEGSPDQDETWQQPVFGTDVTAEMAEPIITFRVTGTEIVGSGSYRPNDSKLFGMAVWTGEGWTMLKDSALTTPIRLIAVPTIHGVHDVEFVCADLAGDLAHRVS